MPIPQQNITATADINRIVQGEALTITVEIFDQASKRALNLEGSPDIMASFPGTEAPVEITEIEILDAGRLNIMLESADTVALKLGAEQSWQIEVTLADNSVRIVQLLEVLEVVASLF